MPRQNTEEENKRRWIGENKRMTKKVYSVVDEKGRDCEIGEYVTYGIMGETIRTDTGECIEHLLIHDVTTKKDLAERWAKLFEEHQLSLIHLQEVIEDRIVMEA